VSKLGQKKAVYRARQGKVGEAKRPMVQMRLEAAQGAQIIASENMTVVFCIPEPSDHPRAAVDT
jgi:hypothetical protein